MDHLGGVEPVTPTVKHTQTRVAECARCGAYVLAAHSQGQAVAVDPQPLGKDGVTQKLLQNLPVYVLKDRKLYQVTLHTMSLGNLDESVVVGAHGCGCAPRDVAVVTSEAENPRQAPATRGIRQAGRIQRALGVQGRTSSVAASASRRPSSAECQVCGDLVDSEPYVACEWRDQIVWIFHERCT